MYRHVIAVLLLAVLPVILSHHEIHKRMTAEQIQEIFQTNLEDVPDYKVVQLDVSRIHKRDTRSRRSVKIVGFTEEIKLFLEPTDGMLADEYTPVTIADTSSGYLQYIDQPNVMRQAGEIMQDPLTRSSFVVSEDNFQRYTLNGFIEALNLVVKSLPNELSNMLSRTARSVDNSLSLNNTNFHVIFPLKKQPFEPDHPNHYLNETRIRSALTRNKRNVPKIVYPEMLLVVDYSTYILHGSNSINVVRYLLALWNAVDMRFRNLANPKIRLNIARIIIATTPEAAPYITYNMPSTNTVHAQKVFDDAGIHFYLQKERIPLDSYDVLIMMTRNMLTTNGNDVALGYAIVGGACMYSSQRQRIDNNGIFHDDGSYYAWGPAHEMGHLLGANHDTSTCPSTDGYVMTPAAMSNDNSWTFSPCSQQEIFWFLHKNSQPECLYNIPKNRGKILRRLVPGLIMSIDEQCRMANSTGVCTVKGVYQEYNICQQLICADRYNPNLCTVMWGHSTAEGTQPCNEGKGFCLAGQCVV